METTEKWTNRTNQYFAKNDIVVLSDMTRYDYKRDAWVYSPDYFFRNVMNSSEADPVTEDEARKIVEAKGGKNFDKQDERVVITDEKGQFIG